MIYMSIRRIATTSVSMTLYNPFENLFTTYGLWMKKNVNNCLEVSSDNYPIERPLLQVLDKWITDDTMFSSLRERPTIHQGLYRFNFCTVMYREAELSSVLWDDPKILELVERWAVHDYFPSMIGKSTRYMTECNKTDHLIYFQIPRGF